MLLLGDNGFPPEVLIGDYPVKTLLTYLTAFLDYRLKELFVKSNTVSISDLLLYLFIPYV
jgi:hypothetical protein